MPLLAARLGFLYLAVLGLEAARRLLSLQDLVQQGALPLLLGHPRAVPFGWALDEDSDLAELRYDGLGVVFTVEPARRSSQPWGFSLGKVAASEQEAHLFGSRMSLIFRICRSRLSSGVRSVRGRLYHAAPASALAVYRATGQHARSLTTMRSAG